MGCICKRGRSWYIDIRVKGRRIRRKVGRFKKIAELALKDAEVKVAQDQFGFSRDDLAIDTFFERFFDYSRANHRPRTTTRYRAVIDHFQRFLDTFPSVTFQSEISPEVIGVLPPVQRPDSNRLPLHHRLIARTGGVFVV